MSVTSGCHSLLRFTKNASLTKERTERFISVISGYKWGGGFNHMLKKSCDHTNKLVKII